MTVRTHLFVLAFVAITALHGLVITAATAPLTVEFSADSSASGRTPEAFQRGPVP